MSSLKEVSIQFLKETSWQSGWTSQLFWEEGMQFLYLMEIFGMSLSKENKTLVLSTMVDGLKTFKQVAHACT